VFARRVSGQDVNNARKSMLHQSGPLVDQVVVSGSNFVFTVIAARSLGLSEFSHFTLLWLLLLFINSIHMAVIVMPMLTLAQTYEADERQGYYNVVFRQQWIFNAISTLFCIGFWLALQKVLLLSPTDGILIAALSLAYHTQEFYRRYFFSETAPRKAVVADTFAYVLRFVPIALLLISGKEISVDTLLGSAAGAYAISCIVSQFYCKSFLSPLSIDWRAKSAAHWQIAKFLLPSAIMQWLSVNFHMMVAGAILGIRSVGIIRIGQTLIAVGNVYLQALENHLPLEIGTTIAADGDAAGYRYVKRYIYRGSFMLLLLAIAAAFAAPEILGLVYGEAFRGYAITVYWFGAIYILAFASVPLRALVRALSMTEIWFRAYIASTVLSLLSFYPLQRLFGINGVMMGMLLAWSTLVIYTWIAIERRIAA
jgi:O-antigen/teichoic acid export membrane protein